MTDEKLSFMVVVGEGGIRGEQGAFIYMFVMILDNGN